MYGNHTAEKAGGRAANGEEERRRPCQRANLIVERAD